MSSPELLQCRSEIDAIDATMIELLAKRFRVVDRVVLLKQRDELAAEIPERIETVVRQVRDQADKLGLPPETAEALWRLLIAQTIAYERARQIK